MRALIASKFRDFIVTDVFVFTAIIEDIKSPGNSALETYLQVYTMFLLIERPTRTIRHTDGCANLMYHVDDYSDELTL